jgi:hypothetical protein
MKKIIELSALVIVIMTLSGLISQSNVDQEINLFVKGIFHKLIPWVNLDFNL